MGLLCTLKKRKKYMKTANRKLSQNWSVYRRRKSDKEGWSLIKEVYADSGINAVKRLYPRFKFDYCEFNNAGWKCVPNKGILCFIKKTGTKWER